MTNYTNKPLPPLFVEADTFINKKLRGNYESMFANGNNANGEERWHLRYLYARIKAVLIAANKASNDMPCAELFTAVETSLLEFIRDNSEVKDKKAKPFNLYHQKANPGMDVKDAKTRHHPDFNDKQFNGGKLGHGSDYNTEKREEAEVEEKKPLVQKWEEEAIDEVVVKGPLAVEIPSKVQHQLDRQNEKIVKLQETLAEHLELFNMITAQITALQLKNTSSDTTIPKPQENAKMIAPQRDLGVSDEDMDSIVDKAQQFEAIREAMKAKSPQPIA